jgi:thiamine biosynthesis protein ThiI
MGVMYDAIIIHYAEIFLKGSSVKRHFELILLERIRQKLLWLGYTEFQLSVKDHALWIHGQISQDHYAYLAKTFGVRYLLPIIYCKNSLNSIKEASKRLQELSQNHESPSSFRVKAKKEKGLSIASKTVELEVLHFFPQWKLSLSNPSLIVHAVLKKRHSYLGFQRFDGPGGLPYGASGKVIALVSKGIDSTVAAWMIAKRGCELVLLHFGDSSIDKIRVLLESYAGKKIKLIQLPHQTYLNQLKDTYAGKYLCIFCKVGMYYAAQYYAEKTHSQAIVTGENLGQVASQTLNNMVSMSSVASMLLLRPLVGMDKEAIINLAKQIGSFALYINPQCAFVPSHPSTAISSEKLSGLVQSEAFTKALCEWKLHWPEYEKQP